MYPGLEFFLRRTLMTTTTMIMKMRRTTPKMTYRVMSVADMAEVESVESFELFSSFVASLLLSEAVPYVTN